MSGQKKHYFHHKSVGNEQPYWGQLSLSEAYVCDAPNTLLPIPKADECDADSTRSEGQESQARVREIPDILRCFRLNHTLRSHLIQTLDCASALVKLLLDQMCQDGEYGEISPVVRATATRLFNLFASERLFILEDCRENPVTCEYDGNKGYNAVHYGLQIPDNSCRFNRFLVREFNASDGLKRYSLDRLTVRSEAYIPNSLVCNTVTYSEGLSQLNKHLVTLRTLVCQTPGQN